MVIKSWETDEALEFLAEKYRNGEVVEGVVRSLKSMKLPREVEGKIQSVEETTLLVALPGGVTGYCPASEFREREFRSYVQFVTLEESFVITGLDLENQIAFLSANRAAVILREELWKTLELMEEQGTLENEVFEAVVTGFNQKNGVIHARISGQDVYMYRSEWSWNGRDPVNVQQGETIEVKVQLFDKDSEQVRVSRRLALPDPSVFLSTLKTGDIIAARVKRVDPIKGLLVEVEDGIDLKAGKVRALEEPDVGDYVSCRVQHVDSENRRGRVVIINYPRGKRKKKDLGSFLFE